MQIKNMLYTRQFTVHRLIVIENKNCYVTLMENTYITKSTQTSACYVFIMAFN
jgi:hypothetical protein